MAIREKATLLFRSEAREALRTIGRLEEENRDLQNRVQRGNRLSAGSVAKWATAVVSLVGAYKALRGTISFVASSVGAFRKFEAAMAEVATISDVVRDDFGAYSREVQRFATRYAVDAEKAAKSLYQVISAGIPQESALLVMGEAMKFAKASLTDAAAATDLITGSINAYGLEASEAARVSDTLFTTIRLGKTTGEELAATMGRVTPIAASAGVSFRDLNAAMVLLTRSGLSTEEAVTGLRALLSSIVAPASETKDVIKELNLELFNEKALQEDGGLFRVLEELGTKTDGTVASLSEVVPNIRALVGALAIGNQLGATREVLESYDESAGATEAALSTMMQTLNFALDQLGTTWEVLKQRVGEGFAVLFGEDIQGLAESMEQFVQDGLDQVGATYDAVLADTENTTAAMRAAWEELKAQFAEILGPDLSAIGQRGLAILKTLPWGEVSVQIGILLRDGIAEGIRAALELAGTMLTQWMQSVGPRLAQWWSDLMRDLFGFSSNPAAGTDGAGPPPDVQFGGGGFQLGGLVTGRGVDTVPARLAVGERVVRRDVSQDAISGAVVEALNAAGPAALHLNLPNVTDRSTAMQVAPRLASGLARFQQVGGLR